MAMIGSALIGIAWLMGLVIVIKIFQKEGAMKGILALICEIYAWIWGWQHAKENNNAAFMWIWTGLYIVGVILSSIGGASAGMPAGGGGEVLPPTEEGARIIMRVLGM